MVSRKRKRKRYEWIREVTFQASAPLPDTEDLPYRDLNFSGVRKGENALFRVARNIVSIDKGLAMSAQFIWSQGVEPSPNQGESGTQERLTEEGAIKSAGCGRSDEGA